MYLTTRQEVGIGEGGISGGGFEENILYFSLIYKHLDLTVSPAISLLYRKKLQRFRGFPTAEIVADFLYISLIPSRGNDFIYRQWGCYIHKIKIGAPKYDERGGGAAQRSVYHVNEPKKGARSAAKAHIFFKIVACMPPLLWSSGERTGKSADFCILQGRKHQESLKI